MTGAKLLRSCGTHDGTFHADEVTACALLCLFDLIDADSIVRTRDLEILSRCEYVCDVGGVYDAGRKLFDHHQVDYQGPLSSAGMILLYLETLNLITRKEKEFLNCSIIIGVDAHDNGKELNIKGVTTYSQIVSNFTPIAQDVSSLEQDEAFFEALKFAHGHLRRLWDRYRYMQSCRQIVADAMSTKKEFLVLEKNIPWQEVFFELEGEYHPAKFLIMPSGVHWKLRGIPPSIDEKMKVRMPLPKEWAGLLENELRQVTGIPGAIFCHKGRFISVWATKSEAMQALEYVLSHREL